MNDQENSGLTFISGSLRVVNNNCNYTFYLTVNNHFGAITGGFIRFILATGFANPVTTDPTLTFNAATREVRWNFGNLAAGATESVTFTSAYTGPAGVTIYTGLAGGYNPNRTFTVTTAGETTTANCTAITTECCEDCNEDDFVEFPTTQCQDIAEDTVTPEILQKGRMLFVHLNLQNTCNTKDVNVGVFVNEVVGTDEVPIAHRVVRRTSAGSTSHCAEDKSCNCVQFMINDTEETACLDRTFRVRTVAHYVDQAEDTQQCQCGDCNRP